MQVIAGDVFNGTVPQVQGFKNDIGATFPFLLNAGTATGGNFYDLFGDRDDYVVINKQGICRLNTFPMYPYGARYDVLEIRACIDSLVTAPVDVATPRVPGFSLTVVPNPFHRQSSIDLALPAQSTGAATTVAIFDLSGRRTTTLWSGRAPAGSLHLDWDGRADGGVRVAPGIYVVRAEVGGVTLARRVTRLE